MLLPHNLTADNFCSLREDEDESTMTLYDWLHQLFGDTAELDEYELSAMEYAKDYLWLNDERIPLEGTDDYMLVNMCAKLTPFEQHAIWCDLTA